MDANRVLVVALVGGFVCSFAANVMALRRMHALEMAITEDRARGASPGQDVAREPARPAGPTDISPPQPPSDSSLPLSSPASSGEEPVPPGIGAALRQVAQDLSDLRGDVGALKSQSRAEPWTAPAWAPVSGDPEVATVLNGQAEFKAFWGDVRQVFQARSKLEPEAYTRTVMGSTMNFLGLGTDGGRDRFRSATERALGEIARIRREESAAQALLPPKENKPLYDEQRRILKERYDGQMREAREHVRRELDLDSPRHREFADRLGSWLRELGR